MKFLLSILAATTLTASTSTNIIGCGTPDNQKKPVIPDDGLNQEFLTKVLNSSLSNFLDGELSFGKIGTSEKTVIDFSGNGNTTRWKTILNFVIDCYQDPEVNIFQEIVNGKKFDVEDIAYDATKIKVVDPDLIKFAENLKVEKNWEDEIKSFSFEGHQETNYLIPLSKQKILETKILKVFAESSEIKISYQDDLQIQTNQKTTKNIDFDFKNKQINSKIQQDSQFDNQNQKEITKGIENLTGEGFFNYLTQISETETYEVLNAFTTGFNNGFNKDEDDQQKTGSWTSEDQKIIATYNFENLKINPDCEQINYFISCVKYSWDDQNGKLVIDYDY